MLAAKVFLEHIDAHAAEVYPRLGETGRAMRQSIQSAFADAGILARCTGAVDELECGSSMVTVHFPHQDTVKLDTPEAVFDSERCDIELREKVLGLALLVEDVHLLLAHGSASTAHTDDDVAFLTGACRQAAARIARHR